MNRQMFDEAPMGARIADRVTGFLGSWRFLILQTILVAVWLAANIVLLSKPFDPLQLEQRIMAALKPAD